MNEHILVVDDSAVNLKLACHLLKHAGYMVRHAVDAETALAMIQAEPPALLLLDLQLPQMDGLTLARLLKADEKTRNFPIVALTAHAMKGDAATAYAAGCDGYLPKPVDTRRFAIQIAEYLGGKKDA
jgi:CheY-like chemotaxis protein